MIYFISGNDKFLIDKKINELIKMIDFNEFDVFRFDGSSSQFNINNMIYECDSLAMFGSKKIIYVFNPSFLNNMSKHDEDLFVNFVKNDNLNFILILYGDIKLDKKTKLYKFLSKNINMFEINKLTDLDFKNLIMNMLIQKNIKLENDAFNELIFRLDNNLDKANHEIEKLSLLNEKITLKTIQSFISKPLEYDIFKLINTLSAKDLKNSINIWKDFKRQNIEALSIILILATQIRFMFQVKYLKNKGFDNRKIADILNCKEGRIHYISDTLKKYSISHLLNVLDKLANLDQDIKSGKIDPDNGLELFIINLTR